MQGVLPKLPDHPVWYLVRIHRTGPYDISDPKPLSGFGLRPVSTPGDLLAGVVFCRYFSLGLRSWRQGHALGILFGTLLMCCASGLTVSKSTPGISLARLDFGWTQFQSTMTAQFQRIPDIRCLSIFGHPLDYFV
jgi:hypothetical protein